MSRKFLITVILILFLLPFVSWYYLQSGLNWRKQAQVIMGGKQVFPQGEWIDQYGKKLTPSQLADHVTIVTLLSCANMESIDSTIGAFYDQFKETDKANFILLNQCYERPITRVDSMKINWYVFNCSDSTALCDSLKLYWPADKTHALIDRNKIIRSYYGQSTKEEKRILLEHMALLLPRDRSDKIELKRGNKQ